MPIAHLIGVPLDLGGNRRGVDMGPSAIRIAALAEQLASLGVTVIDKGDVPSPLPELKGPGDPRKRYVREIARVCQKLYQTALASLHEGALPIVLGGDHSLGAGSVAASAVVAAHTAAGPRPHLGGCARRHQLAGHLALGQRARHAAGGVARRRAAGAGPHRRPRGRRASRAHRARRHPQPRRSREGDRQGHRASTPSP